jgi:hypothetical protein
LYFDSATWDDSSKRCFGYAVRPVFGWEFIIQPIPNQKMNLIDSNQNPKPIKFFYYVSLVLSI